MTDNNVCFIIKDLQGRFINMRMTFVVPPEPGKEVAAERSAGCTRIVYPMPNIYELIAAACLEDKGHKVKLVDFVTEKGDADAVERFLRTDNSSPYLVWSVNLSRNADFAFRDMALRLRPEAKVIFMGPGATFFPELYLTDNRVTIVRGEPEATLLELAEYLEKDKDFSNLQGLILLDSDGAIKRNPARPLIQDIDTLPFPARTQWTQLPQSKAETESLHHHAHLAQLPVSVHILCTEFADIRQRAGLPRRPWP